MIFLETVKIDEYSNNKVILNLDGSRGWLVASERFAYFPGWKAYVNGRELPITNEKGVIGVTASVTLQFTETPVRLLADIISIVSIITLLLCILL